MYSKFCNDLMRSCCGEDVAGYNHPLGHLHLILIRVKCGSDSTK